MYQELSKEDFLKTPCTKGWVLRNYVKDLRRVEKKLTPIFGERFSEMADSILCVNNGEWKDIIIPESIIPKDEKIQLVWTINLSYLMDIGVASPLISYRYRLKHPPIERKEKTMTFFEKELNRCTEQFDTKKFIGNAMYIPLGENNRLKVEFKTLGTHEHYEGIQLTSLDKTSGKIDSTIIKFEELWGKCAVPNNSNFKGGIVPHVWKSSGKYEWYAYKPNDYDMDLLADQIEDYASMFSEQEQVQGFEMSQQM